MAALAASILLSNCGGGNSALLASGGPDDFAQMGRISDQYGTDEPMAIITVPVAGEPYSFRIWIRKDGRRIMAQAGSVTCIAAAGFVRGLTAGVIKGDLEFEPFRHAAVSYLEQRRGPDCVLHDSRKLAHVGWEWSFDCPTNKAGRQ